MTVKYLCMSNIDAPRVRIKIFIIIELVSVKVL